MNNVLDVMNKRRSVGNLTEPAPSREQLQTLLALAMTAPDHKRLMPWRFCVLTGKALLRFGQIMRQAGEENATATGKTLSDKDRQKLQNLSKRAPMIVVVMTDYKMHPKVPTFEQLLAVGACVQNFLLGLESLGYHSVWRTGLLCNHVRVKEFFAVDANNLIAGFIYVGSSCVVMPKRQLPAVLDFVHFLQD